MSILKLGKDNWARTSPTKEGIVFIILTFIVGFSALNTNNNLLYLIFGAMLSLVIISGIISMINLSSIEIKVKKVPKLHALTPSHIIFTLTNKKGFVPSLSLTLEMHNQRSFLLYLPASTSRDLNIRCFFNSRGWNSMPQLNLYTRFPFGFFKKWIIVEIDRDKVLVYPKIEKTSIGSNDNFESTGNDESRMRGTGEELKTIRDYDSGDNKKDIDWKSTAKMNKLMVKEFFDNETKNAEIIFEPEKEGSVNIEKYISEKASLLNEYINSGFTVDFISKNKKFKAVYNQSEMYKVLGYLAVYK